MGRIIGKARAATNSAQTSSFNAYPNRKEVTCMCDRAKDHGVCDGREGKHVCSDHKEELHDYTKAMSNE